MFPPSKEQTGFFFRASSKPHRRDKKYEGKKPTIMKFFCFCASIPEQTEQNTTDVQGSINKICNFLFLVFLLLNLAAKIFFRKIFFWISPLKSLFGKKLEANKLFPATPPFSEKPVSNSFVSNRGRSLVVDWFCWLVQVRKDEKVDPFRSFHALCKLLYHHAKHLHLGAARCPDKYGPENFPKYLVSLLFYFV